MKSILSLTLGAALLAAAPAAAVAPAPKPAVLRVSPEAVNWKPAVVQDLDALMPPAPPAIGSKEAAADLAAVQAWQKKRSKDDRTAIAYWNDTSSPMRWSEEARYQIIVASMVPPRAARGLAIMHAAMYDACVAAWKAKAKYRRATPHMVDGHLKPLAGNDGVPSYPSEDAAIASAAAKTLGYVFPDQAEELAKKAQLVGEARVAAGANFPSDVAAGAKLGEQIADQIIAKCKTDGSDQKAPPLQKTAGKWWVEHPMEPLAGQWHPWLLTSGDQFSIRPKTPSDMKDPTFAAAYREVLNIHKHLTPYQIERARYWNFDVPAILWNDIARRAMMNNVKAAAPDSMGIIWGDFARNAIKTHALDTPHTARMLCVLHLTLADAFIGCWSTKYQVLRPRPNMMAAPEDHFASLVDTPPHPSYPSGHATASMAAAEVLGAYFPEQKTFYQAEAREAAMSRLWGGIHYREDNDDGLILGARIGDYCVQQAAREGWLK